jgi:hypothetical protein
LQVNAEGGRVDYDLDNDGLIEINDLADLDEIRNHLDGSALYGDNNGCPEDGCNGFELTANLDFDTNEDGQINELDRYWNEGEGWKPIGSDLNSSFASTFSGNGHVIRNLYINRPSTDRVGLFGSIKISPEMSKNSITDLVISGGLNYVSGDRGVGLLSGEIVNYHIENILVSGNVFGDDGAGGVTGFLSISSAKNLYSNANVNGRILIGSVLGSISRSQVMSTLSLGSTTTSGEHKPVNGITGWISDHDSSVIVSSYWSTDTNNESLNNEVTESVFGVSEEELKCPVSANDESCTSTGKVLYENWDSTFWNFSNKDNLPSIKIGDTFYKPNDAPVVTLDMYQNGVSQSSLVEGNGDVKIYANISDINLTDQHLVSWRLNFSPTNLSFANPIVFSSDGLPPGDISVTAIVTDSGVPSITTTSTLSTRVISDKKSSGGTSTFDLFLFLLLLYLSRRRPDLAHSTVSTLNRG